VIPILTTTSTIVCPHGGIAQLVTSNADVLVDGAPVLLQSDVHPIVGCPFTPVAYSPCVAIRWVSAAAQTKVRGVPVLLQTSVGLCVNAAQVPQGTAVVVQAQGRARGL
jgi:hypothetical protein